MPQNLVYQALNDFLPYRGEKYISPPKAGSQKERMESFKKKGQKARKAFQEIGQSFSLLTTLSDFEMQRVSQWMNQAQIGRPHFWAYYIEKYRNQENPALALRLLDDVDSLGVSLEISFIERHSTNLTFQQQHKMLNKSLHEKLYYYPQFLEEGSKISRRMDGSDVNRLWLQQALKENKVRKVLLKYDLLKIDTLNDNEFIAKLNEGLTLLLPYYHLTKSSDRLPIIY